MRQATVRHNKALHNVSSCEGLCIAELAIAPAHALSCDGALLLFD
jgi:hypothetical protein